MLIKMDILKDKQLIVYVEANGVRLDGRVVKYDGGKKGAVVLLIGDTEQLVFLEPLSTISYPKDCKDCDIYKLENKNVAHDFIEALKKKGSRVFLYMTNKNRVHGEIKAINEDSIVLLNTSSQEEQTIRMKCISTIKEDNGTEAPVTRNRYDGSSNGGVRRPFDGRRRSDSYSHGSSSYTPTRRYSRNDGYDRDSQSEFSR